MSCRHRYGLFLVHLEGIRLLGPAVFRHVPRLAGLASESFLAFSGSFAVAILRTLRLSFATTFLSLAALGRSVAFLLAKPASDPGVLALSRTFGSSLERFRERVHIHRISCRRHCRTLNLLDFRHFGFDVREHSHPVRAHDEVRSYGAFFRLANHDGNLQELWKVDVHVPLDLQEIFRSIVSGLLTTSFVSNRNDTTSSIITTSLALFVGEYAWRSKRHDVISQPCVTMAIRLNARPVHSMIRMKHSCTLRACDSGDMQQLSRTAVLIFALVMSSDNW